MILWRTVFTCFTLIVSTVILTGCWDRKETDDLALVMASGVDLAEDGKIELSFQIALPTAIPSPLQTGGGGKKPVVVVSATGKDGTEAFGKIQQQLSRRIFLGHRAVVVVSEKYARHGFDRVLDPLMRQPESRFNCYLVTTSGATTAKEILMGRYMLEQIPAIGLYKLQLSKQSIAVKIDEFVRTVPADGVEPVSGAVRIVNKGTANESFAIDKAAVYRSHKLAGFLSGRDLTFFRLLKGDARMIGLSAQVIPKQPKNNGTVSARILRARAKIKTRIKKGSPEVSIEIKATVRINENNTNLDLTRAPNLKLIEAKFAKDMQKTVTAMIERTQKKYKADILGVGREIHIQHPYAWRQMKDRWEEIYPTVPITVRPQILIDRTGRMQAPAHLQKTEMK